MLKYVKRGKTRDIDVIETDSVKGTDEEFRKDLSQLLTQCMKSTCEKTGFAVVPQAQNTYKR